MSSGSPSGGRFSFQPGKSDATIIVATPTTGRRSTYTVSLQVRSIEPNESGPSSSNSEVGVKAPIIAFPFTFLPTPEGVVKGILIYKRIFVLSSVLGPFNTQLVMDPIKRKKENEKEKWMKRKVAVKTIASSAQVNLINL